MIDVEDTPEQDSIAVVHLVSNDREWLVDLPSQWRVLDEEPESWLDTIAQSVGDATDRWRAEFGDDEMAEDADVMTAFVMEMQAAAVSGLRDLAEDHQPSLLTVGFDLLGERGDALVTVASVSVLDVSDEPVESLHEQTGVDDPDQPTLFLGQWIVPGEATGDAIMVRLKAEGPGCGVMRGVGAFMARSARETENHG